MQEAPEDGGVDGVINVGIAEDKQRVVAPQLQRHPFEPPPRLLRQPFAGLGRAGKADALYPGVFNKLVPHLLAEAGGIGDHVEHPLGETSLVKYLGNDQPAADWRLRRGL
ncbi:hypothetical protein ES703_81902 [subsurface metagenome]